MALIKSGATSDLLTIDPTSKAARVSLYDKLGNYRGVKATYQGATNASVVAAAGTGLFFVITGSATKTVIVQRITASCPTLTAVAYNTIALQKYSTAPTGGTATVLTQVPSDSNSAAGTVSLCQVYTAAPTAGTLVGAIGGARLLLQATTAAAGGLPANAVWDLRAQAESSAVTLRGIAENVGLSFGSAPASAVTLAVEVEWTEE